MAEIKAFYDEPTGTVSYVVSDPTTNEAAFVDPILGFDTPTANLRTTSVDAMLAFAEKKASKLSGHLKPIDLYKA